MPGTALILGASGRFGRHIHAALCEAGWRVRIYDRSRDDLWDAAWGADLIVNAWNPAYPDWARDLPDLTARVIEVAEATGATVLVPQNVYAFGPDAPLPWGPETPRTATNPMGRLRAEMEAAYKASKARVILMQYGDFLDTEPSGNWFDMIMTKAIRKGKFTYPGPTDRAHAWAFLPDAARAAVALVGRRESLPRYAEVPFAGYTVTGKELHAALEQAWGQRLALKPMVWWPLRIAGTVWPLGRCLVEMSWLWRMEHRLDTAPMDALLPGFQQTPLVEALTSAIEHQVDPDQPMPRGRARCGKVQPV